MQARNIAYFVLGATLAAGGLYGIAVGDLLSFQAGTTIKSAEVNQNFSTLKTAVAALEAPINTARIADAAVTLPKLADGAVTLPKLSIDGTAADGKVLKLSGTTLVWSDDLVGSGSSTYSADETSLTLSGTTFSIKNGGVSTAKLADGAVTASKLADGAVTASKLALPLSLSGAFNPLLSLTSTSGNAFQSISSGGGIGVLGRSSARGLVGTQGNLGLSCAGTYAVGGCAEDGAGVQGKSATGIGVLGDSTTRGVVGTLGGTSCAGTYAVGGCGGGNIGVLGKSSGNVGVRGESSGNDAVVGVSTSANHAGIVGANQSGGFAAYFEAGTAVCSFKAGTTNWACSSDKNLKENFKPVNPQEILETLAHMPVTTWSMKGSKTRQLGPTAQDFYAAFKLGDSDKTINNTDAQGVAMAAIQGLYQKNQDLQARNQALQTKLAAVEQEVAGLKAMEQRLAQLEQALSTAAK